MTMQPAMHCRCDSCNKTHVYATGGVPHDWIECGIAYVDEDGKREPLHLCPECARKAADAWLPTNTWWGSMENWEKVQ